MPSVFFRWSRRSGIRSPAAPRVLRHHSFDQTIDPPDYQAGAAAIRAGADLVWRDPVLRGRAAWFGTSVANATLRIDLNDLAPTVAGR